MFKLVTAIRTDNSSKVEEGSTERNKQVGCNVVTVIEDNVYDLLIVFLSHQAS